MAVQHLLRNRCIEGVQTCSKCVREKEYVRGGPGVRDVCMTKQNCNTYIMECIHIFFCYSITVIMFRLSNVNSRWVRTCSGISNLFRSVRSKNMFQVLEYRSRGGAASSAQSLSKQHVPSVRFSNAWDIFLFSNTSEQVRNPRASPNPSDVNFG